MKAFKLKLIDDKGKILRNPKTSEEKNALTALDRMIIRLRRLVGDSLFTKIPLAAILLREDFFDGLPVKQLTEQAEGETVEITQQEDVVFSFEVLVVSYLFAIKSFFKNTKLQEFSGEFFTHKIPSEFDNTKVVEKLNDIFLEKGDGESGFE